LLDTDDVPFVDLGAVLVLETGELHEVNVLNELAASLRPNLSRQEHFSVRRLLISRLLPYKVIYEVHARLAMK
jgi:hypothetical protein